MSTSLRTPRFWIYAVMIIGGMIWGVHFIYGVLKDAGVWHVGR